MDFIYPPEAEALRRELRAWLDEHCTERFRGLRGTSIGADPERLALMRAWNRLVADAGYATISWPVAFGGRAASVMEQVVWAEEMDRAGAPALLNPIGLANIAPAIMEWGDDDQKERLLPPMRRGDHIWCQGFSEPDAGSDLASLRTSARRDGDHYVVNGQKIWNTLGDVADWCELLVRTDPDAPKHAGISCLLVDMTLPGIETRPITTITGDAEFNEIFFDDVRVPASALLGPEHQGWRVAMTTLNNERGGVATLHLMVRRRIAELLATARTVTVAEGVTATEDPRWRARLMRCYVEGEFLKFLSDRALSAAAHGRTGAEGALVKLVWSETSQHVSTLAAELLGPDGLGGPWGTDRMHARSLGIAGGTTQVNKNIVARSVLGLPKGV
ncbi:MAG: acyl-CoA dehydrogenase family protein [Actinomycetes bacterium]